MISRLLPINRLLLTFKDLQFNQKEERLWG